MHGRFRKQKSLMSPYLKCVFFFVPRENHNHIPAAHIKKTTWFNIRVELSPNYHAAIEIYVFLFGPILSPRETLVSGVTSSVGNNQYAANFLCRKAIYRQGKRPLLCPALQENAFKHKCNYACHQSAVKRGKGRKYPAHEKIQKTKKTLNWHKDNQCTEIRARISQFRKSQQTR